MNSTLKAILVSVAVLVIAAVGFVVGSKPEGIGGLVHNAQETFDAGIAVKGIETISASRVFKGTGAQLVNGTVTTTQSIGASSGGTEAAALCIWNGASYTILRYASNATNTAFTTSTSCN